MKDFFKTELQTLKAKTGLNQYETFSNMPDAAKQIGILLDSMVLACNEFPYIPDFDKCAIIQKMIIQDQDFTALNSRSVWKWLNMHKDIYWTKANGKPKDEPIVFEPLKPETEQMIREFQARLLETSTPTFPGLNLTMDQIKKEDAMRLEGEEIKPRGTVDTRPVFNVDIVDDHGNTATIENVRATSQEKANEAVAVAIRQGDLKL